MELLLLTLLLWPWGACGDAKPGERFRIARDADRFHFVRGSESLPIVLGLNHARRLWVPCDPGDAECAKADLYNKTYGGNITTAARAALVNFRSWNFNGAGYNAADEHKAALPYFSHSFTLASPAGGPNAWQPKSKLIFPDPWDPAVIQQLRQKIITGCAKAKPYPENNLGYLFTDEPLYDVRSAQQEYGKDWVSTIRCFGATAAGMRAYVDFLQTRYPDVAALCSTYGISGDPCKSWDALRDSAVLCALNNMQVDAVMTDDYEFLPIIAEQLYSVQNETVRECDPGALVWGDVLSRNKVPPNVIRVAAKYCDGLAFQPGGVPGSPDTGIFNATLFNELYELTGKPLIIADVGFAFPHPRYPNEEWHKFASQQAAGDAYRSFVAGVVNSSFLLGLNKCMYIDRVLVQPETVLKPGMLDFNGTAHQPFSGIVAQANQDAIRLSRELLGS